jgi:hypothetical protein
MQYVSLVLVLLSTIVAIRGSTWRDSGIGLRRITPTGWATLTIAIAGFLVAIIMTLQAHRATVAAEAKADETLKQLTKALDTTEAKVAAYQEVIGQIRDRSDRWLQLVMTEYVRIPPGGTWPAPNRLYPGSELRIYFLDGRYAIAEHGRTSHVIRRGPDDWGHALIVGDSGDGSSWTLRASPTDGFAGKVEIFSTPRSRSQDRSWYEERIARLEAAGPLQEFDSRRRPKAQ